MGLIIEVTERIECPTRHMVCSACSNLTLVIVVQDMSCIWGILNQLQLLQNCVCSILLLTESDVHYEDIHWDAMRNGICISHFNVTRMWIIRAIAQPTTWRFSGMFWDIRLCSAWHQNGTSINLVLWTLFPSMDVRIWHQFGRQRDILWASDLGCQATIS